MHFENIYKLNLAQVKHEYLNGQFVFSMIDTISWPNFYLFEAPIFKLLRFFIPGNTSLLT